MMFLGIGIFLLMSLFPDFPLLIQWSGESQCRQEQKDEDRMHRV